MIQDIIPDRLENAFRDLAPEAEDPALCFQENRIASRLEKGRLRFPAWNETGRGEGIDAFSVNGQAFFLALGEEAPPAGYDLYSLQELRTLGLAGNTDLFAVYTGFHLRTWYRTSRFCGACGGAVEPAHDERALVCPRCGNRIYPRINPAVIVGVMDGERLLITRYRSGFRHNALIAGFTEIGETVEQTVEREVMEEVGLRVKNIRYYKSQPWGIASDLLMGFYCEVDGDPTIHREERELGYAQWVPRQEIVLQPSDHSLTNEMMKRFRDGQEAGRG